MPGQVDTAETGARPAHDPGPGPRRGVVPSAGTVAVVLAVAASVACYAGTTSDLWLDEALSVEIARLPLADLPGALRHDGAPPVYYALLHGWIRLFGDGDEAVRSLSAVCTVAALPFALAAGRRLGGRDGGRVALVVVASSPFTIRYATEARMYAPALLLVLAGWVAGARARERATVARLALVAVLAGLLVLTHYWGLYLVAAVVASLVWGHRAALARRDLADPGLRTAAAVAVGTLVALAAWSPVLWYQLRNTGTPWGEPGSPAHDVVLVLQALGGGQRDEQLLVGVGVALLALVGLTARAVDSHRVELDLRTRPGVQAEVGVALGTLALGLAAGGLTGAAFQPRYAAVLVGPLLLGTAHGVRTLGTPRLRTATLAVLVVTGLGLGGVYNVVTDRTQGGDVARAIRALGAPGDVVAYCPDQLGPATQRVLGGGFLQVAYPGGPGADTGVERVDWVDYAERVRAADPGTFARSVLDLAGPGATVWLVWQPTYRLFEGRCEAIVAELSSARPGAATVVVGSDVFEPMQLTRFGPP